MLNSTIPSEKRTKIISSSIIHNSTNIAIPSTLNFTKKSNKSIIRVVSQQLSFSKNIRISPIIQPVSKPKHQVTAPIIKPIIGAVPKPKHQIVFPVNKFMFPLSSAINRNIVSSKKHCNLVIPIELGMKIPPLKKISPVSCF